MNHKIEADSITFHNGQRNILSDIYIGCKTGQVNALLGRNGVGKTCLFNIIYGILKAESKSVRIDNKFLANPYLHSDIITFLPQNNFIPKSQSAKKVFTDFGIHFSELEKDLPELVPLYNLPLVQLSVGQLRLFEIYLIIKSRSYFSLLDEPFSYLSPLHIQQVKSLIVSERKNKGFLITDHMYNEILDISNDVYVLVNGKTHLAKGLADIENYGYISR